MAAMGYEVTTTEGYDLTAADGTSLDPNDFSLMCILADSEARAADADNQAMTLVGRIAKIYDAKSHDGKRLEVQLVLRNQTTLWMIQNVDLRSDLNEQLDVYPFTLEDQWAKPVLTGSRRDGNHCYPLDRVPIDIVFLGAVGRGAGREHCHNRSTRSALPQLCSRQLSAHPHHHRIARHRPLVEQFQTATEGTFRQFLLANDTSGRLCGTAILPPSDVQRHARRLR